MLLNCVVEKDSLEFLELQGDPTLGWAAVHPKGNQSWIFTGRMMLKLKLQYFGHLMQRTESLEKTLLLGKIEDKRRRGQQRMRRLDGITNSMDTSLSKLRELVGSLACCSPWGHKELNTTEWTELSWMRLWIRWVILILVEFGWFQLNLLLCHLQNKSVALMVRRTQLYRA